MKSLKPFDDAEFWSGLMSIAWAAVSGGVAAWLFIKKTVVALRGRGATVEELKLKIRQLEKELKSLRRETDKLSLSDFQDDEPLTGG